jgi:four helix bundle protein
MNTFRTLDLAIEFYSLAEEQRVTGNLRDQLLRASSSISLNLSEGNAKRTAKEKRRYYHTAYASTQECKTILRLIKNQNKSLDEVVDKLGASIYKLMNAKIKTLPYTEDGSR